MASFLTFAGAGMLGLVVPWMLWDLVFFGVLTPTRKSPARAGDSEIRRFFGISLKAQLAVALIGGIMLALGFGLR